jgi:xanthine dehydrogenase YagS FAD-binding subunit
MRSFIHIDALTVEDACTLLRRHKGKAVLNAGGTDLLSTLKGEHLFDYPEAVINIKTIPGFDEIREEGSLLKIGALTKLSEIANSPLLMEKYNILSEAAGTVASPQVRNVATLGGNLCQDVRCWYYRYPRHIGGPLQCARKGHGPCLAVKGDNRYHAIMEAKKCFAVCPSDMAVALAALDGQIIVAGPKGQRRMGVTDFFRPLGNALKSGEMVTEIEVPRVAGPVKQKFLKFALRNPIDFAIVSVASVLAVTEGVCRVARIVLGAVAPAPFRAKAAEELITGKTINEVLADEAAKKALAGAKPLSQNAYKIEIAKVLVKRALLAHEKGFSL